MSARAIAIGLDGADMDVIERLGPEQLPAIFALRERGAWSRLKSVRPPATLPNWITFLTGLDPGQHGVFDFTTRDGYRVAFRGGTVRQAPTIASRLDAAAKRCAVIGFPGTYPPEPLEHGVFISGWDSPVALDADRSFVHPSAMFDAIARRFGPMTFDDVDEFGADSPGWHRRLPAALEARIERKTALAEWLLNDRAWDLFAIYFGESDTAAHHLFSIYDERSPRYHDATTAHERDGLARVYRALDRAVFRITRRDPNADITLLSDHGSGPSGTKVLYLNRALEEAGLLTFSRRSSVVGAAKDLALTHLPPRARQGLFAMASRRLPGWVESRARFGNIDFANTVAFSDELNYFPAIHLNLEGREPRGTVRAHDVEAVKARVREAMHSLVDPWTGARAVREVIDREELYRGAHVARAPDLVVELELDEASASYNVMPSASAPAGTGPWRRLARDEYLGRKGRSLPGSHRARGIYITAGPSVRPIGAIEASMADTTVTLLAQLGVRPDAEMPGRVLREGLREPRRGGALPGSRPREPVAAGGTMHLEGRLRAMGYID